jgi:Zn-dependent protease
MRRDDDLYWLFEQMKPLGLVGGAAVFALVVISLGMHEYAHAWVALRRGDSTARDLGRLTLNPIAHIDVFMTIVLPLVSLYAWGIPFGGAKPVPVNPHRLRHPLRDMMLVALAGPLSNVVLAVLFLVLFKLTVASGQFDGKLLPAILYSAAGVNLVLAIFNMLPVPPLDGSRVMAYLLPGPIREPYVALESFGLLLVLGVVFLWGGLGSLLNGAYEPVFDALNTLTGGVWW